MIKRDSSNCPDARHDTTMALQARMLTGFLGQLVNGPRQQLLAQTRREATVSRGLQPCRRLHLYKTARSKTVVGMHKILGFKKYEVTPASASQHVVDVVRSEKIKSTIASGISLVELYDNHVKPGHMLYLADQMDKNMAGKPEKMRQEQLEQRMKQFAITEARSRPTKAGTKGPARGPLKVVVLMLTSPTEYFKLVLNRAHEFLLEGSPVEFRFRLGGKNEGRRARNKALEAEASEEKEGADGKQSVVHDKTEDDWVWIHQHFPHVRPDFILKGMPEGTVLTIDPVRNAKEMNFVMELPTGEMPMTDLNKRLEQVKKAVGEAKKTDTMGVPRAITEEGGEQYSKKAKPRKRGKEMWPRKEGRRGEAERDWRGGAERDWRN
jgi:hypothetical protein